MRNLLNIWNFAGISVCVTHLERIINVVPAAKVTKMLHISHEDANKAIVVREDVVIVREKEVVNSRLKTLIISHFRASNTSSAENRPNYLPLYQKQDIPDFISFY